MRSSPSQKTILTETLIDYLQPLSMNKAFTNLKSKRMYAATLTGEPTGKYYTLHQLFCPDKMR